MNVTDSFMLQQIQQMAANMTATLPEAGSSGNEQSFQDMMSQAGQDSAVTDTGKDSGTASQPAAQEKPSNNTEVQEKPQTQTTEKDAAKNQELNGDPNAMQYVVDLFRPEIVDVSQEEVTIEVAVVDTALDASVEVEAAVTAPVEKVPVSFREVSTPEHSSWISEARKAELSVAESELPGNLGRMPVEKPILLPQEAVQEPVVQEKLPEVPQEAEILESVPEQEPELVTEQAQDVPESAVERPEEDAGEDQGQEAAEFSQQPLFRDVEAAPVKVAEHYEAVDTQSPEMDDHMAAAIRQAADDGAQRIQLTLNPANLGQVTVEMTRDASGILQIALHVVSGKAEQLLGQHLDGLHAALAAYGQEVKVEVQRNQEAPQQQNDQHQANPDGHNQQQQQQRHDRQDRQTEQSGDFLQKLRLGLFETEFL